MPSHKSCKKRMKTSELERVRNRAFRTQLRAAVKAVRSEQNKDEAIKLLKEADHVIDRVASKGIIPKTRASRSKSRLAIMVNKLD